MRWWMVKLAKMKLQNGVVYRVRRYPGIVELPWDNEVKLGAIVFV